MSVFSAGYTRQCSTRIHVDQDKFGSVTVRSKDNKEVTLAVIADGVSMGFQGKYASYNTVLWLLEWASAYLVENSLDIKKTAGEIQAQMREYNRRLNEFSDSHSDKDTCCTVCGMVTDQKQLLVFNAGDSRLYELTAKGKVRCMTKDDKAEDGYSISMHIGGKNDDEVKLCFSTEEFHSGSRYVLCTDGFYRKCDFSAWHAQLMDCKRCKETIDTLEAISESLVKAGETDDITALLIARCE